MNWPRSWLTAACVSDDWPRSPWTTWFEVEQVALRQRLVEPVVVLEGGDGRGVGGGLLAEVGRDRVRRHELREQEDDRRDAEQQEQERGARGAATKRKSRWRGRSGARAGREPL